MTINRPEDPDVIKVDPRPKLVARSPVLQFLRRMVPRLALFLGVVAFAYLALIVFLTALYRAPGIQPYSTLMMADLITGKGFERQWVTLADMGKNLPHSVIMSEDGQFCRHRGVDFGELKAVVDQALEGESPRGASTLTMQLAKNLFLWPSRSYVRKILEIPLAMGINLMLPKWRQMEIYLNIAEWGEGIYGAGAGAQAAFNKAPAKLTRREAALMTVALPNPIARNPAKPSQGMVRLARLIERRAAASGDYVACLQR